MHLGRFQQQSAVKYWRFVCVQVFWKCCRYLRTYLYAGAALLWTAAGWLQPLPRDKTRERERVGGRANDLLERQSVWGRLNLMPGRTEGRARLPGNAATGDPKPRGPHPAGRRQRARGVCGVGGRRGHLARKEFDSRFATGCAAGGAVSRPRPPGAELGRGDQLGRQRPRREQWAHAEQARRAECLLQSAPILNVAPPAFFVSPSHWHALSHTLPLARLSSGRPGGLSGLSASRSKSFFYAGFPAGGG
jgi:hypothetical protein